MYVMLLFCTVPRVAKTAALPVIFDSAWADIAATRKITPDETETARFAAGRTDHGADRANLLGDMEKLRHEILQVFWSNRQSRPPEYRAA
jgi:hypothetical protein